jgi:predicted house-cleaning noncanonical NTP pyrophosphatase (MazG superfamily)
MLTYKKYIIDLKFKFFQSLLDWSLKDENLTVLENYFYKLIEDLKISISNVKECVEIKKEARGDFKENLVINYILINVKRKDLIEKYFLSSDNIFEGKKERNNEVFYKFRTIKAVRDKSGISKDITLIYETEKVNDETFFSLLKIKLFEECKEILRAKNSVNLLEEIGDFYNILEELKIRFVKISQSI